LGKEKGEEDQFGSFVSWRTSTESVFSGAAVRKGGEMIEVTREIPEGEKRKGEKGREGEALQA